MPTFFRRPRRTAAVPLQHQHPHPSLQSQPQSYSPLTTTTTTNPNPVTDSSPPSTPSQPLDLHLRPSRDALSLLLSLPLRYSCDVRVSRRHTLPPRGRIGIARRQLQIRADYLLIVQPSSSSSTTTTRHHPQLSTLSLRKLSQLRGGGTRGEENNNKQQQQQQQGADDDDDLVVHMVMKLPTKGQWIECMINDLTYSFVSSTFVTPVFNTSTTNYTGADVNLKEIQQRMSALSIRKMMPTMPPFTRLTFPSSSVYDDFLSKLPLSSSSQLSSSSSLTIPHTHTHLPLIGHGATSQVRRLPPSFPSSTSSSSSKNPHSNYAVKLLPKSEIHDSSTALHQLVSERLAMHTLLHTPYILRLVGAYQTASHFALVTDLAGGGDLHDLVTRRGRMCESVAKQVFAEIVLALGAVHANGWLYRDMKLGNVLLTENGRVRLADFGLVKKVTVYNNKNTTTKRRMKKEMKVVVVADKEEEVKVGVEKKRRRGLSLNHHHHHHHHHGVMMKKVDDDDVDDDIVDSSASSSSTSTTMEGEDDDSSVSSSSSSFSTDCILGRASSFVGTRRYMSPELCSTAGGGGGGRSYGAASDVWALGVVLYVVLTGRYPFAVGNNNNDEDNDNDDDGGSSKRGSEDLFRAIQKDEVVMPGYLSKEAKQVLRGMLTRDSLDRMDLRDVRRSEWMKDVQWDKLRVDDEDVNQTVVDYMNGNGDEEEEGRGRRKEGEEEGGERMKKKKKKKELDRMLVEEEENVIDMPFSFDHVIGFDMVLH